jgi:hypothetical protein
MDPFLVMMYQTTLSFVAFALIARWYVLPSLSQLPLESALIALSWLHVFRYVALSALLPGQVAPEVTRGPLSAVIYGDTLSGLLALVAILMLKYRISGAIWAAWVFNLVGLADWAQSQVQHLRAGSFQHEVGTSAFVYVFYVPPLVISHLVMLYWLATRHRRPPA